MPSRPRRVTEPIPKRLHDRGLGRGVLPVPLPDRLGTIKVPTLITVGDHDECDPSIARDMAARIAGSRLVILPRSGHMTFVDQQGMFNQAVDEFLNAPKK